MRGHALNEPAVLFDSEHFDTGYEAKGKSKIYLCFDFSLCLIHPII